jgi:hypothetical protein
MKTLIIFKEPIDITSFMLIRELLKPVYFYILSLLTIIIMAKKFHVWVFLLNWKYSLDFEKRCKRLYPDWK